MITVSNLLIPGVRAGRSPLARTLARLRGLVRGRHHVNRRGSARVPVRLYEPSEESAIATLVWAHGGSFVRGSLDWPEADWVARACARRGVRVLSVDYALASDNVKAPGPALDVAAVVAFARSTYSGILAVGGASAGGQLAVKAVLELPGAVDRLVLLYPTLHRLQRADASVAALTEGLPETRRFSDERIAAMYAMYLGEGLLPAGDTTVVGELGAEALALLPPVTMIAAERDDLRVSAEMFAEQLSAAEVPVTYSVMPGTLHGFANRPDESPRAADDVEAVVDCCVAALQNSPRRRAL